MHKHAKDMKGFNIKSEVDMTMSFADLRFVESLSFLAVGVRFERFVNNDY